LHFSKSFNESESLGIKEAVKYALKLKPKIAFPVHDGMLKNTNSGIYYTLPDKILKENGIQFIIPVLEEPFQI
jgi:hypothetical protein